MVVDVLSFDTSTPRMLVVLGHAGAAQPEVVRVVDTQANQASAILTPTIDSMLNEAGASLPQLKFLACGTGPGTFTGSRVAVATAMGLAYGLGLHVHPISTLTALAASSEHDGTIWALLDARRSEVYASIIDVADGALRTRVEPTCASMGTVVERWADPHPPTWLCGTPVDVYADQIPESWRSRCRKGDGITAHGLWRATNAALTSGPGVESATLRPTYLRESYAEMGLNQPKRPVYQSPFV